MIVEMEAASFIGSVLKGRISPNGALGTHLLLVLLLLDFLFFLYLLVVSIDRNYISCLCCAFLSHHTIPYPAALGFGIPWYPLPNLAHMLL